VDQTTLLLSGLVDVRDRHLRALSGIDEAALVASPAPRQFLNVYRDSVRNRLHWYLSSCWGILDAMAAMGEDGWTDSFLLADLASEATSNFVRLAGPHLELSRYLPPSSRVREDLTYLLFRAGGLSLLSRTHERLVSVVIERGVEWSSRSDEAARSAVAVSVPWLETLTPLRWPFAVHELGHYLLPGGDPVPELIDELQDDHRWGHVERGAFAEILADAVAARYCGPAFAQALAREGYLVVSLGLNRSGRSAAGPESLSVQQPAARDDYISVRRRLELLACPELPMEALPPAWNLGPRGKEAAKEPVPDEVTVEMRDIALGLIDGGSSGLDSTCIGRVAVLMDQPEPVAALTPVPDRGLVERLEMILRNDDSPSEAEAGGLIGLVVQEALTDAQIFSAAWRNEVGKDREAYVSALRIDPDDDEQLSSAITEVATRDTWLAQSLQSAAVHRWLNDCRQLKEDFSAPIRTRSLGE